MRSILKAVGVVMFVLTASCASAREAPARPNFLIIVADDLGYSDIGAFGGEIDTPNLDALAAQAVKLTGFHATPACSPTRAMLLTGLDHHEAGLGNMAETMAPNQRGKPNYEGHLRSDTATLAEILGAQGYRTHFAGKWHLGLDPTQDPHVRGFQTSFALLQGAHNHFGLDLVPGGSGSMGTTYTLNGKVTTDIPKTFYSSDYFAQSMIEQLKSGKSQSGKAKPFFAYLAFTAPHWPLQAPVETIAKYKGRYEDGYDALRERRLKRQVELGLLDPNTVPHDTELSPPWESLTPEQKAREARRMEVYAAMVDRMDAAIGQVIQTLKDSGQYNNTVILFMADNGAEGVNQDFFKVGRMAEAFASRDQRIENIGAAGSYETLGPGWASAATAPSWRYKTFSSEGGTRVTAFLTGPGLRPVVDGSYTNVADVVPTVLDLAHVAAPGRIFSGRVVKPIRGKSWVGWLQGRKTHVYGPDDAIGGELFGGRSLRQGNWKITDVGDGTWRLFNIATDPGETRDLSASEPERKARLEVAWDEYAAQVGIIVAEPRAKILDVPVRR